MYDGGKKVAVDRNDERHARENVTIKNKQTMVKQSEDEDQETTLEPGVKVEVRDLNFKGKLLKFSHNKKIVISRPEGRDDIWLTKGDDDEFDIDILSDALQRWTKNAGRDELMKINSQLKKALTTSPLSDLVVYCKERRATLDMTQVVEGKTNTKLRQFNQTGLLKMIGRSNCLDYTCITSSDMDRMIGIINVNTIEAIVQFHITI